MSKIRLNVNSKFQFKSKFGIKINQYSNYVDTLEVKFDYVFKTSYPAIYLYVERNDKSSNTLYSTQLILNQESNCYEYQFGSNDGDINGSWFTAIPGPLKVSFEIIDGDDKFTTDKYSIWINGSVTASNDKITLNANEFNNIINFIQEISDSKLSKEDYVIYDVGNFTSIKDIAHAVLEHKNINNGNCVYKAKLEDKTMGFSKDAFAIVGYDSYYEPTTFRTIIMCGNEIALYGSLDNENVQQLNIPQLSTSELKVFRKALVPTPTENESAINKRYLEEFYFNKNTVNEMIALKADDTSVVHNTGDETIGGVKTFEVEGAKPPIHLKSDMPYVVSDTPHKVGMRAYTEDGQMAGQFAVTYDEEYSGHFANIQARCSEDEIHTFRVSHKGPTYHITKGETKEVHNIPFDENVVHNSGAETINGDKTFYKPIVVKHLDEYYDQWSKTNIGQAYINLIYNDGTVNNGIYLICGAQDSLLMMSGKNNLLNLYPEKFTHTQSKDGQLVKNITVSYPTESGTLATQEYADEIAKNKADKSEVPTKTSQLTNDTGFIDRLVSNLANYYLKNETYSKEEITSLLSNFRNFSIKPVDSLPKVGEEQIIYLVPKKDGVSPDIKEEYLYVNGKWEIIGSTKIDLSNYLTIEQGDEKYALNTNTFSFAEVSVNTPKSLTIKDIYDSIQSQLPNQNSDVILLRITGYLSFTGFAEIRYVGAYLTSLYSFKDNKFVSNYYSSDTYIDDILNSLSSNVDVNSEQEISGTKIFNVLKASSILVNDKEVALKEDIPTDYVDLNSTQNIAGAKSFSYSITRGPKQEGQSGYVDIGAPGAGNSFDRGYITYLNAPISMVTFKPQYDNSLDLGGSNGRWKDLYLSGVLTDNINSIAIADIANKNDIPTFKTINGESIVGEGNIKIETRPLKEYVQAGVTEKQLEPNKYYIFDSQVASNITITLAEEDGTYLDEFMGEIKVDETAINITFPNIIRWNDNGNVTNTDGVLTLEAKNTYLFSVANSLGLITNIPNPSLEKPVTTLTDGILTWEEVEGAQKYEMHYNSELKTTVNSGETLSINVKSILDQYAIGGATFTFVLKALSNYYTDSSVTLTYDKIVQLATPKNLVLSETTLSWDAVDFADSYEVYVGTTKATTVTNNYVDLSTLTGYTGTYDISVKAINASKPSVHLTSDSSETVSYTWEAAA